MEYSAVHKGLIIPAEKLQVTSCFVLSAMKTYRKITKTPLGKRKRDGMMEDIDHAEKLLIDALSQLGVNIGVQWGDQLDLTSEDY